ncbi:hypothetical protein BO82DRAFT_374365 [Aspergillus uvarum CBS 121591]|uniref:Uncharacterized protein n=1 Tax=Aspergillus uvarum CBS 121591 TaxID=1448315 RepID=A0A319C9T3_9EURO|nr:hypothetical protein BO82DRAFT_374365 [Aspergillus uvarum CBS 121591]PYH81984.1 hypothetical protein BO82DRAFT_374365 [Aspergillus uvarum CBS 121591]
MLLLPPSAAIPPTTYTEASAYNRTFATKSTTPYRRSIICIAWYWYACLGLWGVAIRNQLGSVHQNYYGAISADSDDEHKQHGTASHMRHGFDYQRQSLMCAADATLESVDARLSGVTGWGNERVCRDYAALMEWAEER